MDDRLVGRPGGGLEPGRAGVGEWTLRLVSAVILVPWLGLIALALWLALVPPFKGGPILLGVLLLGLAYLVRPRLGSVKQVAGGHIVASRDRHPHLLALIDRVAGATGVPMPDVVALSDEWNAATAVVGLRRQRVLIIGVPLWAAMRPQERVALLGHELAHYLHADSTRGLLTQPARTFFGSLASGLRRIGGGEVEIGFAFPLVVAAKVMSWGLLVVHLGLNVIGLASNRRAELHADLVAASAGGIVATLSGFDLVAAEEIVAPMVNGSADAGLAMAQWREWTANVRDRDAERVSRLRQLSRRTHTSMFASHPSPAHRHRFIATQPFREPGVVLAAVEAELIDSEFARYAEGLRRRLKEMRDGL